jgi:hypothetical protein
VATILDDSDESGLSSRARPTSTALLSNFSSASDVDVANLLGDSGESGLSSGARTTSTALLSNFSSASDADVQRSSGISANPDPARGCQMVHFQTKKSNFGKFWWG